MKAQNKSQAKKVFEYATAGIVDDPHMRVGDFDWPQGVLLYAIHVAWESTGDKDYKDFLENWTQTNKKKANNSTTINANAPLLTYLKLNKEDNEYLNLCKEIAEWILAKAPRTKDGGFEHTVTEENVIFSEQMWADTLFMACMFLAELGNVTKDERYTKEAQKQLYLHHKILKDKATGLFFHGWDSKNRNHMSAVLWGRANAWITYSTVVMLNVFDKFPEREFIIESLREQVEGLMKVQNANGTFNTVLNRKDTYEETSCTAGFAAAIRLGVQSEYIDTKYIEIALKAEHAVHEQIMPNGMVRDVSGGTPIMGSVEEYNKIIKTPALYGQALVLLMLSMEGD